MGGRAGTGGVSGLDWGAQVHGTLPTRHFLDLHNRRITQNMSYTAHEREYSGCRLLPDWACLYG